MSSKIMKGHPEVCEHYCSNVIHGNLITAALTKTDVSDEALIYYMLSVCEHFSTARDNVGRSALHMAASCGKSGMVTWLVTYRNGKLEDKDGESGYTALHRSLFYGKINTAVALIKLGSDMNAMDEECLTPLEHVMKDTVSTVSTFPHTRFAISHSREQDFSISSCREIHTTELYCWGSNSNYTLLDRHERRHAELSHFHKHFPDENINTIHLEKYHCMVTCGSKVYAWGHGLGGRLGLNTNSTVLIPGAVRIQLKPNTTAGLIITPSMPVQFSTRPYSAKELYTQHLDVATDHSIFLDLRSSVWVCGLNEHAVLGVANNEPEALQPICVTSLKDKKIIGVACGKYHSAAYSTDVLYTWGLNGGQLGHTADCGHYISVPKKVNRLLDGENHTIFQVRSSDGALCILASNNVIYILNDFQRRRIVIKSSWAAVHQLRVYGGKLTAKMKLAQAHELHVAVVTATANLLVWRELDPHLRRCVFALGRPLAVLNIALNARGCVFTTRDGEVFLGTFKVRKGNKMEKNKDKERDLGKSAFHVFLEKSECVVVKVNKVPRIHRARYVTSDPDGDNFIVLQNNRRKEFFHDRSLKLNRNSNLQNSDLEAYLHILRDECCDENSLHDFKFVVGNATFYCHRYILAHASTELSNLVRNTIDNVHIVDSVPLDIFEQVLQFIYTGKCELPNVEGSHKGTDGMDNKKEQEQADVKNLTAYAVYQQATKKVSKRIESDKDTSQLKLLLACAKKFGLCALQKHIDHSIQHGCCEKVKPVVLYQRKQFLDFSDIDVICANGDKIKAHKCMLMRLDYFRNMFSARWNQARTSIKIDYPPLHVQLFVDFIYTDTLSDVVISDMENLLKLLVLSDEFIVTKLRALCEYSLCKHINIKTVIHLYQCSISYGACILKNICSQFITTHLTELLEMRSLDSIDDDHLMEISKIYLTQESGIFDKRIITPYSYILNINEPPSDFRLEVVEANKYQNIETQKIMRKHTRRHKSSSTSDPVSDVLNESVDIKESESNVNDTSKAHTPPKPSTRILAVISATEKLITSKDGPYVDFTNLSLLSSSFDESQFPDLSAVNLTSSSLYSKSPSKSTDWRNLPKLSQKARKRLQSESNCSSTGNSIQNTATNPWKVVEIEANVSSHVPAVQKDISEIVKSERLQKNNLNKMRNKLLSSTQIEDKAIFELGKFYNIDNIEDELIEVMRIESDFVVSPTWVAKT